MMNRTTTFSALATSLALMLGACGGGGGSSAEVGTLRLALTDAPACGYDQVNVTVQKVRVNQSSSASESDASWSEVVLNPARRVDLLTLSNGVLSELGQTSLPAGHYTQMRLVLASNDASTPLANSVLVTGSTQEVALSTPSGQQSGLKMNVDFSVSSGQTSDLVLDFNACKSIVQNGAAGNYILKPVISVIPRSSSGVAGAVDATVANTTVSLQQAGVVVKASAPDSTGKFLLQPVPAGSYDLVIAAPGHATTVITGVPVTSNTVTSINTSSPISMATAASGTLTGAVSAASSPIDAVVAATQTLANGDKVEVASTSPNATTGAYSFMVPATAPMTAPYAAASALNFAADASAGSKYLLTATSGAATKTAGPFTVTSGGTTSTNFGF